MSRSTLQTTTLRAFANSRGARAPVPYIWRRHCNDVSSAPNFWTTRINQKLWLNDHSWMTGCNKIFVQIDFTGQMRRIRSVYSQENYRNCCHLMSDFKAKNAPNSISAGAPPDSARGARSAPETLSWPYHGSGNNLPPQIHIPKSAYAVNAYIPLHGYSAILAAKLMIKLDLTWLDYRHLLIKKDYRLSVINWTAVQDLDVQNDCLTAIASLYLDRDHSWRWNFSLQVCSGTRYKNNTTIKYVGSKVINGAISIKYDFNHMHVTHMQ